MGARTTAAAHRPRVPEPDLRAVGRGACPVAAVRGALGRRSYRAIPPDGGLMAEHLRLPQLTPAMGAALAAMLGLAVGSWVVAVRQMSGMDMGVATGLGPFAFSVVLWVVMMAAMMLPGAAPAVLRRAHIGGRVRAVPLFVYELTPLKQHLRRRCHDSVGSGFEFGLYCLGSSIGLMLTFVALVS